MGSSDDCFLYVNIIVDADILRCIIGYWAAVWNLLKVCHDTNLCLSAMLIITLLSYWSSKLPAYPATESFSLFSTSYMFEESKLSCPFSAYLWNIHYLPRGLNELSWSELVSRSSWAWSVKLELGLSSLHQTRPCFEHELDLCYKWADLELVLGWFVLFMLTFGLS